MSKQIIVNKLIDEIENLSATNLELIGNIFLENITGKIFQHHGTNRNGRPVGHTVDSLSTDSVYIAEYSTEEDYFFGKTSFKKIENDITHAKTFIGTGELVKIFLICSQLEKTTFRENFYESDLFKNNQKIIEIWGAGDLADKIFDISITNTAFKNKISAYLPDFYREIESYADYGDTPYELDDNYIRNQDFINDIDSIICQKHICVITGISGSGKTQLAMDYFQQKKKIYEDYIWFDGSELTETSNLRDVKKERLGQPVNLIGSFCSYKTLLVIDNLNFKVTERLFEDCAKGFDLGSTIIITSQIKSEINNYVMPDYSPKTLLQMLGTSSDLAKEFIQKIKLPVVLTTIKTSSHNKKDEIEILINEIIEEPSSASDINAKNVLKKVLNKLDDKDALIRLCNTGIKKWDVTLLQKYIKLQKYKNLETLSLIKINTITKVVQIHDFIFECMQSENEINTFMNFLSKEIESQKGIVTDSLLRQIHLCYPQIEEYCLSQKELKNSWLTYGFLQVESEQKEKIASRLWDKKLTDVTTLEEIRSLVDAKETKIFCTEDSDGERKKLLGELLEALNHFSKHNEISLILLHHIGKCYRRLKQFKESIYYLSRAISLDEKFYPSYLQIAKCSIQDSEKSFLEQGSKAMKYILADIFARKLLPFRISLSVISDLRSFPIIYEAFGEGEIVYLKQILSMASFEGLQQYYEAFGAFISMFSWRFPDICKSLFEENRKLLVLLPELQERKQWVNICDTLTNAYTRYKSEKFGKKIKEIIIQYCEKISKDSPKKEYDIKTVAKALFYIERYEESILLVDNFHKPSHFMLRWKAYSELRLSKEECVITAEKVVLLNERDPKAERYLSSNYELLSDCYQLKNDKEKCLEYLDKAISICSNAKYKKQLEEKRLKFQ